MSEPSGRSGSLATLRSVIVAAGAGALLAACGSPQEVIQSGTTGTNARVGDVLLRNVHLESPPRAGYPPGSDPRVVLTLVNQGTRPDTLSRVETPAARQVKIQWDRDCDGTAETLPRLRLPARIDTTSPPSAPGPTDSGYFLRLVDLTRTVRGGATVPLTFVFESAGNVTVDTKVDLPGAGADPRPASSCQPVPSG